MIKLNDIYINEQISMWHEKNEDSVGKQMCLFYVEFVACNILFQGLKSWTLHIKGYWMVWHLDPLVVKRFYLISRIVKSYNYILSWHVNEKLNKPKHVYRLGMSQCDTGIEYWSNTALTAHCSETIAPISLYGRAGRSLHTAPPLFVWLFNDLSGTILLVMNKETDNNKQQKTPREFSSMGTASKACLYFPFF